VDRQRGLVYGRRRGRALSPLQRARKEALLPRLAIALPSAGRLDGRALFPFCPERVALEIGFGGGEHLAALAERQRDEGFIGCEVFEGGIVRLLGEIERKNLVNIRLFVDDARLLLRALEPSSVDRAFLLFPDPWPKRRHHKRRVLSPETLDLLAEIMRQGAELRIATDDPPYLRAILELAMGHPCFLWLASGPSDWRSRPADWPPTRYEEKARTAGRTPFFLRFLRRPRQD
jgi:tRNA (guanine-N7-)-methyltransferase